MCGNNKWILGWLIHTTCLSKIYNPIFYVICVILVNLCLPCVGPGLSVVRTPGCLRIRLEGLQFRWFNVENWDIHFLHKLQQTVEDLSSKCYLSMKAWDDFSVSYLNWQRAATQPTATFIPGVTSRRNENRRYENRKEIHFRLFAARTVRN